MEHIKVILLQRVSKLGYIGDVVNVKPGYARNYLLPKKIALRATKENLKYFEEQKEQIKKNGIHFSAPILLSTVLILVIQQYGVLINLGG